MHDILRASRCKQGNHNNIIIIWHDNYNKTKSKTLFFLSSRRLEIKTLVSRTTSLFRI